MRRKVAYVLTRSGGSHDFRPQYRSTPAWPYKTTFELKGRKKMKGEGPSIPSAGKLFFYITKRRQGLKIVFLLKHSEKGHHLLLV